MSAELEATERALDRADQRIEVLERALFNAGKLTGTIVLQRDELLKAAREAMTACDSLKSLLERFLPEHGKFNLQVTGMSHPAWEALRTLIERVEAEADGR